MEKTTQEKRLTVKQIRFLQLLLLVLGGLFLMFYFLFINRSINISNPTDKLTNNSVYYQNQRLTIGREIILFKDSADRFSVHGDYLLVSEPFIQTTHIYSLKEKKKVKDIKKVVLDFDGKNMLYNEKGINTYFNGKDLQTTCFGGYIKSPVEILCIVPKSNDNLDNKLISLNPQTLQKTDVYSTNYTLNYVTIIDNSLFVGGYSLQKKENVLIVNGKVAQVPNRVAVVFKKGNNIYHASLQSNLNKNINSYYLIQHIDSNITTHVEGEAGIVLY